MSAPTFDVTIEGTGEQFSCAGDQVVLKAMIALGRKGIPSGCHGGGCGVCKIKVLVGTFRTGSMSREHISEADQQDGIVLACQTYPLSDVKVKVLGKMQRTLTRERRYGFV
jgi:ferredoxin